MTKYKLNNTVRSSSEVTLTSYMTGSTDSTNKNSSENQDDNYNSESNRNLGTKCHFCPHSCEFLQQTDKIAASLVKGQCEIGLNELKVEDLETVCLCERYNGGCRRCHSKTVTINLDGKGSCNVCSNTAVYGSTFLKNGSLFPEVEYPVKEPASQWSRVRSRVANRARACCSKKTLMRRLPIIQWLPEYTFRKGIADLIAGVTVGLTVIPQAIAYAGVAGLPPQYGLYSSFMACFVYTVFGSVKDSAIGPTAIAAILTRENLHGLGPQFAVLLCFLSGCVELLMGILQLGFLIDFISGPVSVGFTSAAAIIIATSQVKDILGLSFPGGKFLQVWTGLYEHIGETRLWDSVLGVSCIVILLLLRKVKDIKVSTSESPSRCSRVTAQALWFLSTTRNILVVLVCAALAYYFDMQQKKPFKLTGDVKPGLPDVRPPPFSATVGNHTYTFVEMASTLGSAIFVVPLLSILENIALAKVFSEGKPVDATQEMVALGLCNMAASFVQSMPVSGALSRGAVNNASGVTSTAGGLYTGILVLLSLQYFTPYFFYIPKASLAAVIIAAVVFMMELHVFKPIWRTKKIDIIPAVVTFTACLLTRLELGILVGIGVNVLFLLYGAARPGVRARHGVSARGVPHVVARVDRALAFPAAAYVRRALARAAATRLPLVLDAGNVPAADYTAAQGMKALIEELDARGQAVIFYNVKPSILNVLRGVKPSRFLYAADAEQLEEILWHVAQTSNIQCQR